MELVSLTEYLVKELLPDVENISVKEVESENETIIQVLVPNDCMSRVIGKGGYIINSLRTIVQASAYIRKLGRFRINVDSL